MKAYGASLDELFEEWRQDLRDRYLLVPASVFALSLWFVAGLLLILAYARKRRQSRRTLARWEDEEAALEQRPGRAYRGIPPASVLTPAGSSSPSKRDPAQRDDRPR